MLRRKGWWSRITNYSDRDIVVSLLRSAGHGDTLDRNVDLVLSSKVKIDVDGNVVELSLGRNNRSTTAYQMSRQLRLEGGNYTDRSPYWDLPESVGGLRKLVKLVLYSCRSIPPSLNDRLDLSCLELHFCDGNTMAQGQYRFLSASTTTPIAPSMSILSSIFDTPASHDGTIESKNKNDKHECVDRVVRGRLSLLKTLGIHGGVWNTKSIQWMKWMVSPICYNTIDAVTPSETSNHPCEAHCSATKTTICRERCGTSHLEVVRFSWLQDDLLPALLDFLSPWKETAGCVRVGTTSRMRHLSWIHSEMSDQGFERVLRGVVLPFHPNLSSIDVSSNRIRSLQFLLQTEPNDESSCNQEQLHQFNIPSYHSLRSMNLHHNPILKKKACFDPLEQQAFETLLLRFFPLLGSLTPSWEDWNPAIEYLLRINRGGRILIDATKVSRTIASVSLASSSDQSRVVTLDSISDCTTSSRNNQDAALMQKEEESCSAVPKSPTTTISNPRQKIPLSVWPLVLHRAYQTSANGFLPPREDATALYYLIRNGPAISELFICNTG